MSGSPSARQGTLSGGGGFPITRSTRTSSNSSSQSLHTAASRQSDNASRSHSTSHPCTSCPGSPCTVSTCRRVCPGAVASSTSLQGLNRCSVGIKYNGCIAEDLKLYTRNSRTESKLSTLNSQRMALPVALLDTLSVHYPNAKILAKDEYDRYHIRVRDDMNALRRELSDFL